MIHMNASEQKRKFKDWLANKRKPNQENYAESTISTYCSALSSQSRRITSATDFHRDLFSYSNLSDFLRIKELVQGAPNFEEVNRISNGALSASLELYEQFLKYQDSYTPCWIFQANPEYYDIRQALADKEIIRWDTPQSYRRIQQGDHVYIWISGKNAGIIADAVVLTSPELRERDMNDPYMRGDGLKSGEYWGVDLEIKRKFEESPVLRSLLCLDERTKKLEIIAYPGATVFSVTPLQESVIENVIAGTYTREPVGGKQRDCTSPRRYWVYAPGEKSRLWDDFRRQGIMGIGWDELGDLTQYASKSDLREKLQTLFKENSSYRNWVLATWQFCREIQIGDIVYAKLGTTHIIGRGEIVSEYIYDATRAEYHNIRRVKWTHAGEWKLDSRVAQKVLTDITSYTALRNNLESMITGDNEEDVEDRNAPTCYPVYDSDKFLADVFLSVDQYNQLKSLLINKKNIILQGAPGVGKSYMAQRLAFSILGSKDAGRVKMIQFHQSYSYEDFMMGYRPDEHGFTLKTGPFYDFCQEAREDNESPFFFIIDEINRGNMSRIFGELLMLIERDKRGKSLRLLYRNEEFSVPDNVHIIGMMNTADRSLALIDYALRRRFAFFELEPAFDSEGFERLKSAISNQRFDRLVETAKELNNAIKNDPSLGKGFCIGHSYFCVDPEEVNETVLQNLVHCELIPLLQEYWFDEPEKVSEWSSSLCHAIEH